MKMQIILQHLKITTLLSVLQQMPTSEVPYLPLTANSLVLNSVLLPCDDVNLQVMCVNALAARKIVISNGLPTSRAPVMSTLLRKQREKEVWQF